MAEKWLQCFHDYVVLAHVSMQTCDFVSHKPYFQIPVDVDPDEPRHISESLSLFQKCVILIAIFWYKLKARCQMSI